MIRCATDILLITTLASISDRRNMNLAVAAFIIPIVLSSEMAASQTAARIIDIVSKVVTELVRMVREGVCRDGSDEEGEEEEEQEMMVEHDWEGMGDERGIYVLRWIPLVRSVELVNFDWNPQSQILRALQFESVETTRIS